MAGVTRLSAPIFDFGDNLQLPDTDKHLRDTLPEGTYALSGPSVTAAAGHLAVRGDLAHIKLAGLYFVPHYAAPVSHAVAAGGGALRKADAVDAETVEELPEGTNFDVLDISGQWAWGQVTGGSFGEDGPVGYVALSELKRPGA